MKNFITTLLIVFSLTTIAGCSNTEMPMSDKDMAEKYGMTMEKYKEMKDAAARMNMSVEDHMKHMDMDGMDMK